MYQSRSADVKPRDMSELDRLAEEHGFDSERLHQLETWAGNLISSKKIPGVVLAVARKGKIIFHEALGSNGFHKDSIMEVGSMATPLICATFLSLVDEGRANIDDPVTKFLPYFDRFRVHVSGNSLASFKTEPLTTVMTMRHLLTSTWGFPGTFYVQSKSASMRALDAMATAIHPTIGKDSDFEKLVEVPLISQPGTRYRDSIAPTVVAHIICKITGGCLQDAMRERILGPLGMIDTSWSVPPEKRQRAARQFSAAPWLTNRLWGNMLTGPHAGHTSWLGWVAKERPQDLAGTPLLDITDQSPLYSTAVDQLAFHSMLLNSGATPSGVRVLSPASVQMMTTDRLQELGCSLADTNFNTHANDKANSSGMKSPQFGAKAEGQGLGLGLQIVIRPVVSRLAGSKGTFSSWGFSGTECWSDPALELSVFVGTQLSPFWALPETRQEVAGSVYGSLVSTSAAKHIINAQGNADGGAMGQMMNMMMMMSMLGGGGSLMGMGGGVPGTMGAESSGTAGAT